MKVIEYGEGDPAWLEPECEADEELIKQAEREKWSIWRLIAESTRKPENNK